jgi:hypothetical protein
MLRLVYLGGHLRRGAGRSQEGLRPAFITSARHARGHGGLSHSLTPIARYIVWSGWWLRWRRHLARASSRTAIQRRQGERAHFAKCAKRLEQPCGKALVFTREGEQQVLGPHMVVAEPLRADVAAGYDSFRCRAI